MSKRLILILVLAFVVGIAFTAYAEVQNVKVSGDITVKGVARDNFDLAKPLSGNRILNSNFQDNQSDILSITRVRIDADLTDNVSTTVRLLNERPWNGESNTATTANRNIGLNSATGAGAEEDEIGLDLAYVTLKEFLYSPLSLMVGRQELHFGNDLIVGDPDTNLYAINTALSQGDLSARKSFDAIRATLDYNPLVVDVLYAKITEDEANLNDDVTLSGLNASYALNKNTTLEGYLFNKIKGGGAAPTFNLDAANAVGVPAFPNVQKADIVNTVGVRAVDKTVKNLTLDGQIAYQFGSYNPNFDPNARYDILGNRNEGGGLSGGRSHTRSAWAAQLKAIYDLKDMEMLSKYSPALSAGYTYLSGADRDQQLTEKYKGWDPMFENQTEGHIINAIFANTNMHRASVSAKAKLTDDITANVDYIGAWFAKRFPADARRIVILSGYSGTTAATSGSRFVMGNGKYIGQEIDATLSYDYTEDVQFSLLGGIFLVGNNIFDFDHTNKSNKANATELIGSMKVTF